MAITKQLVNRVELTAVFSPAGELISLQGAISYAIEEDGEQIAQRRKERDLLVLLTAARKATAATMFKLIQGAIDGAP